MDIIGKKITVKRGDSLLLDNISFSVPKNGHLAITGSSGSGKTTLGLVLADKMFYQGGLNFSEEKRRRKVWVEQQHHFKNKVNTTDLYYQQRYNSYDSEETQTVEQCLQGSGQEVTAVLQRMRIEYLRSKPLIQLSNGENKKLQIARALLYHPSVLILDQPFTGLDVETRRYLHELLQELSNQNVMIIVITSPDEIPGFITHVLSLDKGCLDFFDKKELFDQRYAVSAHKKKAYRFSQKIQQLSFPDEKFENAIYMRNVNVQYGEREILKNINWEVKKGERWLLSGPNGAGKSTLLSLVTADNPQAYANEVYLFDKRRGKGESIWDIKKRIGFLSPELHLFFDQSCNCFEAIASGLFDTIGLFRQLSQEKVKIVEQWMDITGVQALRYKTLHQLSTGEQRIVLLARALVKNPPLLILDEPCQGIDEERQDELLQLIDEICLAGNKTMVFVTHYSNARPACIDKFLHLENGQIVSK